MPMHIIIDGYNLIGGIEGLRGDLEGRRDRLVRELREYKEKRGYPITVVFDGWRSGWLDELEKWVDGIRIIYSKRGEKADDVIVRLARQIGGGCAVVTSDREVRDRVEACGAAPIYAGEFRAKLGEHGLGECSSRVDDEDGRLEATIQERKKGNPRKLSKRERRRREKLRRL